MTFESLNLHPLLSRNLTSIGYETPRPIQTQAIPAILAGRDVIGLARTGTGKTAAFVVPIAHHLLSQKPPRSAKNRPVDPMNRLRALVICPTRELAQQVADEAALIAQGSVLRVACAFGKVSISPQAQALARGVDLLVVTPGRARELIEAQSLSLAWIKHVVIDEADRMLDMGFLPQIQDLLKTVPPDRQMLLFTATMPSEIEDLARTFLNNPVRVESEPHSTPAAHVQQHLLPIDDGRKVELILHFLQHTNKRGVLIFCRTRRRVGWVGTALQRHNIAAGMLHGDMSQAQRTRSLNRFAARELRVLVATDVAARGLHIDAVKTVMNYDLPLTAEEYVHRIGRAAHGGEGVGESFTLLSDDRDERLRWREVMDKLGVEVYAEELEGFAPRQSPEAQRRQAKARNAQAAVSDADDRPISNRAQRRKGKKPRRARASRPIKKGETPGRGVVRKAKS